MRNNAALIILLAIASIVSLFIMFTPQGTSAETGVQQPTVPCGSDMLKDANEAKKVAKDVLDKAIGMLDKPDQEATKKFQDWFGGPKTDIKIADVASIFRKIRSNIDSIAFECYEKQESDKIADVDHDGPYKIFLFPLFAKKPMKDKWITKSGNLIHEMTHFDVIAGTVDLPTKDNRANGRNPGDAHLLSPKDAKQNANNYQFLAEALAWNLPTP